MVSYILEENICNHIFCKELICKIYKEILELKNTNSTKKYEHKSLNKPFTKVDIQLAKRHRKSSGINNL